MADALTSLLAIVALLSAKYFGWIWMDPVMGIFGAVDEDKDRIPESAGVVHIAIEIQNCGLQSNDSATP